MENKKKYKILSTFTGAGGLDIGFHGGFRFLDKYYSELPFETAVASDINLDACHTLSADNKYFKDTDVICADITKYDYKQIKGDFDVLLGGFPCVTFSVVGKQAGITDNKNGQLYESYAKYVEHFRPKVFLAENVKGILSANKGEAVKIIKQRFEIQGYKLKVFLVNFADFGVPQLRQRVLFIGVRDDIKTEFIPPEFTNLNNHVTVQEAFKGITKDMPNNELLNTTARTTAMLKLIPPGGNYKDLLGTPYQVKGLMSNIYRRLKADEPSYTMIASGGGGTWTYHYDEPRPLTNRERARIQTFPDDLVFKGTTTEVRRQIGNAVPAVGIYHFACRIADVLNGIIPIYKKENCIKELYIPEPSMTKEDIKKIKNSKVLMRT